MARLAIAAACAVACLLSACGTERGYWRGQWSYRLERDYGAPAVETGRGGLFFRSRPLPDDLDYVLCPIGGFARATGPSLSRRALGWWREGGESDCWTPDGDRGHPLDGDELGRGWYPAAATGKRAGTPAGWIWALIDGRGYWLDARGLFFYPGLIRRGRATAP